MDATHGLAWALTKVDRNLLARSTSDRSRFWFAAAEQGINAVFALTSDPDARAARIIKSLAAAAFPAGVDAPTTVPPHVLSRLYFALGHVAVKLVVHVESLGAALKKAQAAAENAAAARGEKAVKEAIEVELGLAAGEEEEQAARLRDVEENEIVCRCVGAPHRACV